MKKLIFALIFSLVFTLTACNTAPQAENPEDFFTSVSAKNFQSDKTSEELEAEIAAFYKENDIISWHQQYNCNFENDEYRVAVYSFVNSDYSDHWYFILRFKDDNLVGYIQPDNAVLEEAIYDWDSLSFYDKLEYNANDDLSHIELNNSYSTARSFVINFDDGSFEYVKKDIETDLSRLNDMNEEQRQKAIADEFLKPLAKAGLIGDYYKDTDQITKMLKYLGFTDLSDYETFTDENGQIYATVPKTAVREHLSEYFNEVENYALEYNDLYDAETDTFKIYIDKEEYPYNIYVSNYTLSASTLIVDFTVTDKDGREIFYTETCYFTRNNNNFCFNFCKDFEFNYDISQDTDRFVLSIGEGEGGGDSWAHDIILTDRETGKTKNLGREAISSAISDYGFFSNGDIYVMNYRGLDVFDTDMDNPNPIFTTKTNFPCTKSYESIDDQGTLRYMFAIRRDPVTFEYVVIYGEYIEDDVYENNYLNDFQLAHNYRIGILDKNGNLVKSWDTGVPIMFTVFGFENTYMKKVGDNEYEMFVAYKDSMRLSGRFNTEKETYIPIKEFKINQ